MADIDVSGAGTSAVNGGYDEYDNTGKPRYYSPGFTFALEWGYDEGFAAQCWKFDDGFGIYYKSYDDVATPDLCTTWVTGPNGSSPVPSVTAGASLATVTTQAVSSIGTNTATGNGNVTSDGGATVTERGVVVNTSTNPTVFHSKFPAGSGGTGSFAANMTGLAPGTFYYVRAYAINTVGTSYGDNVTFTTSSAAGNSGFFQMMRKIYNGLKAGWKQVKGGLWVPEYGM